MLIGVVDGST